MTSPASHWGTGICVSAQLQLSTFLNRSHTTNPRDEALLDHKISYVPGAVGAPAKPNKRAAGISVDNAVSSQELAEGGVNQCSERRRRIYLLLWEIARLFTTVLSMGRFTNLSDTREFSTE